MRYLEHLPRPPLRPFVRLLWSLRAPDSSPASAPSRIVPDGCPEIVVNRADRFRRLHDDGDSHEQAEVLLVGQFRRAITIVPTGEVDLIGIRFEPGGLHALLGIPMQELCDQDLCLGQAQTRLRDELLDAARPGRLSTSIRAIENVLARRLERGRRPRGAGLVGAALRLVESGLPNVDAVANGLRIHRRSLERLFRGEVGLSPKLYMRIHRLQAVLRRLEGGRPPRGWAQLAARHGYADQSHLIRDFRLLARTTPQRYLAERTPLGGFFELGELSRSSNPERAVPPSLGP